MKRVLLINQHDSFVYNLVQTFRKATPAIDCRVMDYDYLDEDEALTYDGLVLSPGPGLPEDFRERFPYCAAGLISRRRALCWASVWVIKNWAPCGIALAGRFPTLLTEFPQP